MSGRDRHPVMVPTYASWLTNRPNTTASVTRIGGRSRQPRPIRFLQGGQLSWRAPGLHPGGRWFEPGTAHPGARGSSAAVRDISQVVAQRIPGRLEAFQSYNDSYRGWPVLPLKRQHPIRGSFLDPRPDRRRGAIYHEGVDIAVRDDRPERGRAARADASRLRDRGGPRARGDTRGVRGFARIGHFGYGHIDVARRARRDRAARPAHRLDVCRATGTSTSASSSSPGAAGGSSSTRCGAAGSSGRTWIARSRSCTRSASTRRRRPAGARRPTNVARLPQAGRRLNRTNLSGRVDIACARAIRSRSSAGSSRCRTSQLRTIRFESAVTIVADGDPPGRPSPRRLLVGAAARHARRPALRAGHGAEPARERLHALPPHASPCDGTYWFRALPAAVLGHDAATERPLLLRVRVWDVAGNMAKGDRQVTIRNGSMSDGVKRWDIRYRAHNRRVRPAVVLVPARFGPRRPTPTLPLVISPHGRNVRAADQRQQVGGPAGARRFALVCPGGQGRRLALPRGVGGGRSPISPGCRRSPRGVAVASGGRGGGSTQSGEAWAARRRCCCSASIRSCLAGAVASTP